MIKLFSVLAVSVLFIAPISVVHANPPMPAFYADVIKMKPDGKLGQVIKQEKIDTSIKGAQAWRIAYISSDVGG